MIKNRIILVISLLITLCLKLYSVDWTLLTPKPDCLQQGNWKGPNEIKICVRDLLTDDPDLNAMILRYCDINCCFRIIFWDRWTGQNNNEYELMVTGIFTSGGNNCENCIVQTYSHYFARLLYDRSRAYENFKQRALSTGRIGYAPNGNPYSWIYTYSIGQCESEGTRCYWTCCKYYTEIQFWKTDEFIHGFTNYWVPDELIPPCDRRPCTSYRCFQTLIWGDDPTECPICEGTGWVIYEKDVPYYCYPDEGCVIHIKYRRRIETNCPEQWKDYYLMEYYPLNCGNCSFNEATLHSFVTEWILKYGGHELPENPGDVRTNWRFMEQACWTFVNEQGIPKYKECPNNTACCLVQYRVEKINNEQYEFTPIFRTTFRECTDYNCRTFCVEPRRIVSYESSSERGKVDETNFYSIEYINNEIRIKIKNKYKGSIRITIFDILGNVILQNSVSKNSIVYTTSVETNKLSKGIFFVRCYLDEINYIVKPIFIY